MTDSIIEKLTGPGGPFEFVQIEVNGVPCRVFRDTPAYLSSLYETLPHFADKTLVVYEGRRLTYSDATAQAATLAAHLRDKYDIRRGSRVAIVMRNAPEWIVSFLAITSLGAVAVLVNSRGKAGEIAYCLESTSCTLAVTDRRCAEGLDDTTAADIPRLVTDVPEGDEKGSGFLDGILAAAGNMELQTTACDPEDPALILFTSGTTGRPKGAVLTHRGVMTALKTNQFSNALIGAQMAALLGIDLQTLAANRPQTCTLLMFPLFHVSGCHSVLLPSLAQGGKVVLMRRWNAESTLQLIEREKITVFPGVPTMHWDLLQVKDREKYDLSSLSALSIGGQATPVPLLDALKKAFPAAVIGTGYGMTETNGAIALTIGEEFLALPSSAGKAVATSEIRIMKNDGKWAGTKETGEICVRGATVMSGYDNRPEANAECFKDGWFRTGDVGYLDEEQRLYIVDRQTDMVISGGENIYCAEIERVLSEHPSILEDVTFGIPDDRLGEKLVAMVRLRDGESTDAAEIEDFLGKHLAAYKIPKIIAIVEDPLPRNPAGKIPKPKIRELFLSTLDDSE
ncbi:MAG: AMP-binding protein [Gammaproteobacteria bacterium]|nr:AMP-binding protein [Gammaproteobacteria bacterium]MDH3371877.1 AMP-binding protein [Gammaproteobacteria bacterium]MDH3407794.1 AMP-binding protein [Gammaproteobacteria bacterium]MDH3551141.1 AMP-binding protein [Gammaproteobacteria bacterium]